MLSENGAVRKQCSLVADALLHGRVVPFLGAGVNLCDRPEGGPGWKTPGEEVGLPSGRELAEYLADKYEYPAKQNCTECGREGFQRDLDLARVSQYGVMQLDEGPLKEELRRVFKPQYKPTTVHRFLAELPLPKPDKPQDQYPLIVTTNYDDLIEQALGNDNLDLVFYNPADDPPRFWHKEPGKAATRIDGDANQYPFDFFKERPVVLKIHGTIDRASQDLDGFVITEDDYIQYLAEEPLENFLPSAILCKMRQMHHLLFLGYGLRDWNLRVFLRRLNRTPDSRYRAWAIYQTEDDTERQFWGTKGIQVLNVDLRAFMDELRKQLEFRSAGLAAA